MLLRHNVMLLLHLAYNLVQSAQPAAVQSHAALGDKLCGRAHIVIFDHSP